MLETTITHRARLDNEKDTLFAARMPPAAFCERYENLLIIKYLELQFPFCK